MAMVSTKGLSTGSRPKMTRIGLPVPADAESYQRIVLVFDGDDDDAVLAARAQWTDAKARGSEATYWQPDEQGRWVKKA